MTDVAEDTESNLMKFWVCTLPAEDAEDQAFVEHVHTHYLLLCTEWGQVTIRMVKPSSPEGPPLLAIDTDSMDMLVEVVDAEGEPFDIE